MSSGFIQLAAIGQQDVHLTGAPDLTYYASVYKRHTPFVLEAFEVPFDGSAINMGQNNIVRIPVKGDLVRATTLKLTLPPLAEYGQDWFWPNNFSNLPYVSIDNLTYFVNPPFASQYFSSIPASFQQWAGPIPGVTYDPNLNKFIFRNVSFRMAFSGSDGVFWGFDPKNPSYKGDYGNLFYTPVNGVVTPDFTLEQCGWTRSIGRPVNTLSSLFLSRISPGNPPVDNVPIDFTAKIGLNSVWTNEDSPGVFTITPAGITFTNPGTYVLRTDCSEIAVGLDNQDLPNVSRGNIPFSVDNSTQVLSLYIYSDITYVYIEPIDFFAGPVIGSPEFGVLNIQGHPFEFTRFRTYGFGIQDIGSGKFTFNQVGQYLISCNFQSDSNLISNVSLFNESTAIDNYRWINTNPDYLSTGEFFLPVTVSNTANIYSLYINSSSNIYIDSWSFVTVTYLGLPTGGTALYPNGGYILPLNGILAILYDDMQIDGGGGVYSVDFGVFNINGVQNMISFGSNVTFSNVGTYMCTSHVQLDTGNFISLTFSNTQYNYSLTSSTTQTPIRVDKAPMTLTVTLVNSEQGSSYVAPAYFHFSPLTSSATPPDYSQYHYYDSVGTWAIETADLKVGGQTIESLTGESIEIWNDLNVPYENQPGLKLLTGKYDMTIATGRDYYINLPFYFYEKSGSYLPISIIDRQDVEIWVTFRPLQALTAITTAQNQVQASLIVEYVYLAQPEITWLSRTNLDYMIEQYQYRDIQLAQGFTHGIFELNFENPIKELFFVIQVDGSLPYDWSNDGLVNLGLTINGEELMTTRITDPTQLGVLEPMENFINFPTRNFYMKTFKSPINFSRLRHVGLDLKVSRADGYYPAKTLRVVAVNMNAMRVANGLAGLMFISQ
jgi:hypothetical protein